MPSKSHGVFVQLGKDNWAIDTKVKVDDQWKHFKKSGYPTLSAAKADYETAKEAFIKRNTKHHSVMFFEELVAEYKEMRKAIVDVSTIECDQNIFKNYLMPYFGGKLLKDCIVRSEVNDWYRNLINNNKYSNKRKSKVITRMKDLLKFAYMHEFIDAPTYQSCDVCLYQVKYSKQAETERIIWTKDEETAFFNAFQPNSTDYLMFRLFFTISPRLGEFLALQPNCFNYNTKKITIKQQVKNINGQGAVLTDKLKTHESYRTIILDNELADLLKNYIDTLSIAPNDYLFRGTTKSLPLSRNTFRRKLYKYCELAGVRKINPHASRHLQATKLAKVADSAEFIEAAARRLGHSPEMFLNTYAKHSNDTTESELLKRIAEA